MRVFLAKADRGHQAIRGEHARRSRTARARIPFGRRKQGSDASSVQFRKTLSGARCSVMTTSYVGVRVLLVLHARKNGTHEQRVGWALYLNLF